MNKTELQRRNAELEIAIILMKDAVKSEPSSTLRDRIKNLLERTDLEIPKVFSPELTQYEMEWRERGMTAYDKMRHDDVQRHKVKS